MEKLIHSQENQLKALFILVLLLKKLFNSFCKEILGLLNIVKAKTIKK
jgi:hypothetical protein